jgi:hypothetical protein
MTLLRRVNWASILDFVVRHLGWTIVGVLLLVACVRGSANTPQMMAIVASGILLVPIVVVCMIASDAEEDHHPMFDRLARPDVLMALTAVILYINYTAGLTDYIG